MTRAALAALAAMTLASSLSPAHAAMISETTAADPTRAVRVGFTLQNLLHDPFPGAEGSAPGVLGSYEFILSQNFTLALAASYRRFPGSAGLSQLGYGALLRHRLSFLDTDQFQPYVSYGLMMQVSSLRGDTGAGTSHDTRLSLGTEFEASRVPLYAEASYHLSRLRFLNVDSLNLDYWEFTLGWRTAW